MGQYWELFNLDKVQHASCGGAKMGEFFYADSETFMLNLLLSGQPDHNLWGGDRIILLGDYSGALPPNTVTDDDPPILKQCIATEGQPDAKPTSRLCAYRTLSAHGKEISSVRTTTSLLPDDTVYILRSLDRKEYVRRDVVGKYRKYPQRRKPGLSQALYTLVGWSDDPSASLAYNSKGYVPASGGTAIPLHRGAWAGNRIDVVALTDEIQKTLDEERWTDISEEKARHVSDVYACDDY